MSARRRFRLTELALIGALAVGSNFALAGPISLPQGGVVISFFNMEQIDPLLDSGTDIMLGGQPTGENAWGILIVDTIRAANPASVDQTPPFDPDLGSTPIFTGGAFADGQVTGMFYSLLPTDPPANFDVASTGGRLDLYWDDPGEANTPGQLSQSPDDRTGLNMFTNFTDGILLASFEFASGIAPSDADVTLQGTFGGGTPPMVNQGNAEGYLSVRDFNGDGVIDSSDGVWAGLLDSDFFDTAFGLRDIHFRNTFTSDSGFDPTGFTPVMQTDVFGANSSDPASAVVPEPATTALLGLGLLAMGASAAARARRRR